MQGQSQVGPSHLEAMFIKMVQVRGMLSSGSKQRNKRRRGKARLRSQQAVLALPAGPCTQYDRKQIPSSLSLSFPICHIEKLGWQSPIVSNT